MLPELHKDASFFREKTTQWNEASLLRQHSKVLPFLERSQMEGHQSQWQKWKSWAFAGCSQVAYQRQALSHSYAWATSRDNLTPLISKHESNQGSFDFRIVNNVWAILKIVRKNHTHNKWVTLKQWKHMVPSSCTAREGPTRSSTLSGRVAEHARDEHVSQSRNPFHRKKPIDSWTQSRRCQQYRKVYNFSTGSHGESREATEWPTGWWSPN